MCDQQHLRSACAYARSDKSLCWSLEYPMSIKLLTEHHLEFLSLKGGCTGYSESTHVKIPHCWKSRVTAKFCVVKFQLQCIFLFVYFQVATVSSVTKSTDHHHHHKDHHHHQKHHKSHHKHSTGKYNLDH